MITKARTVGVHVSDQDRAKNSYVDTLGFELRAESPSARACAGFKERVLRALSENDRRRLFEALHRCVDSLESAEGP